MRLLVILALGLLASCTRNVPNMICKAEKTVQGQMTVEGPTMYEYEATDVFRVANGRLYHRYSGREEYLYGDIKEVEPGRYVSGQTVFVMYDNNKLRGYVVIAGPSVWSVSYLDCTS